MARKKQEAQLQTELETQEQWEDMLAKEGVIFVDVFQEWCGPCTSMVANLRRLRNELGGDELLKFAVGKADTVESLEKYRGKCEPCFHFYAGGQLVNIIRGANSPLILQTIVDELNKEKKVLAGEAERAHFVDPVLAAQELARLAEKAEEEALDDDSQLKEVTVAIVKPNVFAKGNVDEIVQSIEERFEMLAKQEFTFTEEWVKEFYANVESEPIFEELIEFMTSGPCLIMVLTNASGDNVCTEFREFIGNKDPNIAKQENPDCLRAMFGDDTVKNGIHGSEPGEAVVKETSLVVALIPDLVIPQRPPKPKLMQIAIVIPSGLLPMAGDKIKEVLDQRGYRTIRAEDVVITPEIFEKIHDQVRKDDIEEFSRLHKEFLNDEPCCVIVAEKLDGIPEWIEIFGPHEVAVAHESEPQCLAAQIYPLESGVTQNQIYFSHSYIRGRQDSTLMLRYLDQVKPIPKPEYTIAAIKPDALLHRDDILQIIHESGFQIVDRRETKMTPEMVMRMYMNHEGTTYFSEVIDYLVSGPTLFLILFREEAITGWRALMGPADPEKAKIDAPDSIRAKLAKDVIRNAVFGADSPEEAAHELSLFWGENAKVTAEGQLEDGAPIASRPPSGPSAPSGTEPAQPPPEPEKIQSEQPEKSEQPEESQKPQEADQGAQSGQAEQPPQVAPAEEAKQPTPVEEAKQPTPTEEAKPPAPAEEAKQPEPPEQPQEPAHREEPVPTEQPASKPVKEHEPPAESTLPATQDAPKEEAPKEEAPKEEAPKEDSQVVKDCKALHKAMEQLGTDDDTIVSIATQRSREQRLEIVKKFKEMFDKEFLKMFKDDSSGDYRDLITSLFMSRGGAAAHQLKKALAGINDDEMLIEIICTSSYKELEETKKEYQEIFGSPLQNAIEGDTSGSFREVLVRFLNRADLPETADEAGATTDASNLIAECEKGSDEGRAAFNTLLTERSYTHLRVVFAQFKEQSGKDVEETISDKFSGDTKDAYLSAVQVVRNKNVYLAKRLRKATEGLGTHDEMLVRIIGSRYDSDMPGVKQEYEKLYGTTLEKDISGDTSGDYKKTLIALLNAPVANPAQQRLKEKEDNVKSPSPPPSNLPKAPSIPSSPVPEEAQKPTRTASKTSVRSQGQAAAPPPAEKPSRTASKTSVKSVAKSVKGEPPKPTRVDSKTSVRSVGKPPEKPTRTDSKTSVKSVAKSVKEGPSTPAQGSRRPSNASVKSQSAAKPVEEEAKEVEG